MIAVWVVAIYCAAAFVGPMLAYLGIVTFEWIERGGFARVWRRVRSK